ncbi:carbamoyltransferase HypF [Costertonia aggregata]|uniref:Carbamoyltransferase n=1 Tax=Costertonia aggregata TaxID=343403 RepID=A0A7H9AKP2_9FLAO|nr:carbamoyltransferase HypF [Costertonia aggregata]QLG44052.1 carbamoyltransferase HypF [Costertonia aggregata]
MLQTFEITISGQVQGVGFRPFVYGLAKQFQLKGSVCNNQDGVLIHINTSEDKAKVFLGQLLDNAPEISIIQSHSISEISFQEYDDFKIISSDTNHQIDIPLTPDFAICESCKEEIRDRKNRRFGYAFTTCTNCGPRYAVTAKFPFERANTTVSAFAMCDSCQTEYTNPDDRRFHSQTNSCADCGIQLQLVDTDSRQLNQTQSNILKKTAALLSGGSIIAIKNTNGYLLCCDANNKETIERLRKQKQRPAKPFALLYPSLERIKNDFQVSILEEKALTSSVAPIVILNPKAIIADLEQESIASKLNQLGVMLPSSALLTLLMDELQIPIIATSGNIHGSPIISEKDNAIEKLTGVADYFLHHDLAISFPQDDSVVRFAREHQIALRRSRGLAPNYLSSNRANNEKVLAMGAHLKSTFTFTPNSHTYVSPYFGNLDSYDVSGRFQESIDKYSNLFDTRPETILIDKHPQYQSSILGKELSEQWKTKLIAIQHHKAHFASVLGEHQLFDSEEKILGIIWDGTGYGEDNAIWGGEFFSYANYKMERLTHFEYVDWIAADKMAKEPRLSLLSMLPETEKHMAKTKFSETEWKIYNKMLVNNSLKTSSVGRLFDAVTSLLLDIDTTSYEGEAAMLLENQARNYKGTDYIDFLFGVDYQKVPIKIITQNIQKAIFKGYSKARIANSFIYTLALAIIKVAEQNNFSRIACSGGVFQNAVLVEKLLQMAEKKGFELKFNRILSSNDENISIGQLWYHQHIKN